MPHLTNYKLSMISNSHKHFLYMLMFIAAIVSGSHLHAQKISGVVSDVLGPMPGVNAVPCDCEAGSGDSALRTPVRHAVL